MSYLWYWPGGGWDFDKWKAQHPWDPIRSQQSGNRNLLPLLNPAETKANWEKDAAYWRTIAKALLGTLTDTPPDKPTWEPLGLQFTVNPRTSSSPSPGTPGEGRGEGSMPSTREQGGHASAPSPPRPYTMQRLRYKLTSDEWGYAWLLVPEGATNKRLPTILALHQTVPAGKHEAVGLEYRPGNEYLAYAAELAQQGFVVFAPDAIAFGERLGEVASAKYRSADDFFKAHPDGSVMAKMVYDTSRAVDLLQTLPMVDPDNIGCIGHSHGGYGTLFAMLADDRIKAGVISCGVTLLRADPHPERWFRRTALIPRLGYYEQDIAQAPIDFHHLLALLAPRPVAINVGLQDAIFPNTAPVKGALDEVRKVYALYGAEGKLLPLVFDGPHSFPEDHRRRAYDLLANALHKNKS